VLTLWHIIIHTDRLATCPHTFPCLPAYVYTFTHTHTHTHTHTENMIFMDFIDDAPDGEYDLEIALLDGV
jgi:hypothetical protein